MRIRKRKVPLPLSLLSPVPLSDPHLFSRSPVTVVQGSISSGATSTTTHNTTSLSITHDDHHYSQPSDLLTLTCSDTSPSDLRRLVVDNSSTAHVLKFEGVKGVRTSNDDASNPNLSTAKGGAVAPAEDDDDDDIKNINNNIALLPHQSLSNNEGRWCDDDKAIPLKKRRGMSFNNTPNSASAIIDTMISMKYDSKNNEQQAATQNNTSNGNSNKNAVTSGKKGSTKRGNTIMEGSRCSRVNGRGWRCCQPTLVGYSLCEHHLGKGRLRSMTTTRAKPRSAKKKSSNNNFGLGGDESREMHKEKKHDDDDDDETLVNKKVKLGVVKARSLSSLLGQTNTMNHIAEDHASLQQQHQGISNFDL